MAVDQRKRKRNTSSANKNSNTTATNDDEITDISSDEELKDNRTIEDENEEEREEEDLSSDEEFKGENSADKRRRLAKQYLQNLKEDANDVLNSRNDLELEDQQKEPLQMDEYNNFDAGDLDREIIASRLKLDVAEKQGRVYRFIADKLLVDEAKITFSRVGECNLTCLSCFQPVFDTTFSESDDHNQTLISNKNKNRIYCYTVSKDLQLTKYDVTDFTKRPKKLKFVKGGKNYLPNEDTYRSELDNNSEGHYDELYAVAASPDGKFVVTGGKDRKLIVWSSENLAPLKVLPTRDRRGEVLALTFRKNSDQLFAACSDYKVRTYSINQFAQLETLYGHQDHVVDISALLMERCVTVGSLDKSAMLWKISEESRLTFRSGFEDPERLKKKWLQKNPDLFQAPMFYTENSIDTCSMIDDSHFVTGSDNGNISLWSTSKKKPIFTYRTAHGIMPIVDNLKISGEKDAKKRDIQLQGSKLTKPYWITSIYAIPYSNVFISGSWDGILRIWKVAENLREFELLKELPHAQGIVTKIQVVEKNFKQKTSFRILCSIAKEHRLGRWINRIPNARNGIYSVVIEHADF
ncbi:probable Ribosomal RNA-processing protein 9 [Saccharomycodes ludwigii]|uniref:Probable Ribosomal RNA-processing protein 9 n=1 Tax=Saccharomycodes ludwigii TaxID=36035 RepID=A0A376B9A4_9ASCO|nr:probable Ribosomal RNA-processing protein 9 [Saccharomycodes ludwigii]